MFIVPGPLFDFPPSAKRALLRLEKALGHIRQSGARSLLVSPVLQHAGSSVPVCMSAEPQGLSSLQARVDTAASPKRKQGYARHSKAAGIGPYVMDSAASPPPIGSPRTLDALKIPLFILYLGII